MNGVLFYGKHLAEHTNYKKIFAIAVSGNEKRHRITPIFVDKRDHYIELPDIGELYFIYEKYFDQKLPHINF